MLIIGGSISSTVGVEYETYAWGKGNKEKIGCQLVRKSNPRRSSYLACEDVKRRIHTEYEHLLPAGSDQTDDANFRHNPMPRLISKPHIYRRIGADGSSSKPGAHGDAH